jgi:plasmid replication initiation protein
LFVFVVLLTTGKSRFREEGGVVEKVKERGEQAKGLVLAEGNFEEHPYFRVGDRNAGTGVMTYENELRTRDGHVLRQSWTVRAAHGRGLPGRFDQDVYVALLQMIDDKGLPEDGWLSFSLYELVELMGRKHSGRDYRQVRESLRRLATTSIESDNAFYHRGRKEYISDTFSLLSEVKLSEYEDPKVERTDRNRVLLSQYFVDSYKANYLKNIDVEFYWSLASPIAKRLYRLVDKKRNGRRLWEAELFLLKDRIPLSDYKYASKIKEKLDPAHEELRHKGFLEGVTYRKTADSAHLVCYEINEGFTKRRSALQLEPTPEILFAVERLKAEGVRLDVARQLVAKHGPERCLRYSEAVAFQKNIRNRAGWLRWAIEEAPELDIPAPAATKNSTRKPQPLAEATMEEAAEIEPALPPIPDPRAEEVWNLVLQGLSKEIDVPSSRMWFVGVVPTSFEDSTLRLYTPNSFAVEYIESRFGGLLRRLLQEQAGPGTEISLQFSSP